MKRKLASSGYTIVEVLIVLAVSGALLVSVMALISGQQEKTEFTAALRDFESRLQDIMNDVSTGTYPESINRCSVTTSGPENSGVPSTGQGTSDQCVFVGKAMQLSPSSSGEGSDMGKFNLYTMVGRRFMPGVGAATTYEPQNIQESDPRIISTSSAESDSAYLNSSLEFKEVFTGDADSKNSTYGLAFVASFGQKSDIGGTISGAAGTALMRLPGINSSGTNEASIKAAVANLSNGDTITDSITFCIGDTSGGRLGAVRLNGSGTEILFDKDATEAGCSS